MLCKLKGVRDTVAAQMERTSLADLIAREESVQRVPMAASDYVI